MDLEAAESADHTASDGTVTVVVRLKPQVGSEAVAVRRGEQIFLRNPKSGDQRQFAFDSVFDKEGHAPIHEALGTRVLQHAEAGYNCSVFAYGQTGSGKTHTMIGTDADPGLIPRVCTGLFERCEGPPQPATPRLPSVRICTRPTLAYPPCRHRMGSRGLLL